MKRWMRAAGIVLLHVGDALRGRCGRSCDRFVVYDADLSPDERRERDKRHAAEVMERAGRNLKDWTPPWAR